MSWSDAFSFSWKAIQLISTWGNFRALRAIGWLWERLKMLEESPEWLLAAAYILVFTALFSIVFSLLMHSKACSWIFDTFIHLINRVYTFPRNFPRLFHHWEPWRIRITSLNSKWLSLWPCFFIVFVSDFLLKRRTAAYQLGMTVSAHARPALFLCPCHVMDYRATDRSSPSSNLRTARTETRRSEWNLSVWISA